MKLNEKIELEKENNKKNDEHNKQIINNKKIYKIKIFLSYSFFR